MGVGSTTSPTPVLRLSAPPPPSLLSSLPVRSRTPLDGRPPVVAPQYTKIPLKGPGVEGPQVGPSKGTPPRPFAPRCSKDSSSVSSQGAVLVPVVYGGKRNERKSCPHTFQLLGTRVRHSGAGSWVVPRRDQASPRHWRGGGRVGVLCHLFE